MSICQISKYKGFAFGTWLATVGSSKFARQRLGFEFIDAVFCFPVCGFLICTCMYVDVLTSKIWTWSRRGG